MNRTGRASGLLCILVIMLYSCSVINPDRPDRAVRSSTIRKPERLLPNRATPSGRDFRGCDRRRTTFIQLRHASKVPLKISGSFHRGVPALEGSRSQTTQNETPPLRLGASRRRAGTGPLSYS